MKLLRDNPSKWDKIEWFGVCSNPNIFYDEYNEVTRKYFMKHIAAEMMAKIWHPNNMEKFADWGVEM